MSVSVDIRAYEALTRDELYDILHLRCEVFVVGQEITAEPEIDGRDPECAHALARGPDGELLGTARIFVHEEPMSVGRVAVRPDVQRQGVGTAMMEAVQKWFGDEDAELHAQAYLEDWYSELGWRRIGDEYMEAEIPHVTMRWE
jgi:ElaA protein